MFLRAWGEISSATLWAQAPALGASLASVALVFHLAAGWLQKGGGHGRRPTR